MEEQEAPIPRHVHGTTNGYRYYGCRCERCREAAREAARQYRQGKREGSTPEHVHGTLGGYRDYGCRCGRCRKAEREDASKRRKRRQSRPIPEHVHGTANGYMSYGCRCERCREARRSRSAIPAGQALVPSSSTFTGMLGPESPRDDHAASAAPFSHYPCGYPCSARLLGPTPAFATGL
jgi:hypothetical protein